MNAKTCKPTPNYWTALNVEQGASKQKIVAAYRKLSTTMHPDAGGDEKLFALITAAFNALKADPSHFWGQNGDSSWQRDYIAATKPADEPEPKAAGRPKIEDGFVFEDIEGESKDDRRRRYARTRQQYRYANDPEFAKARKEASLRSHAKKAARDKAAKEAAKNASPAAA
jgi:DnaJ-class molecular chaperone